VTGSSASHRDPTLPPPHEERLHALTTAPGEAAVLPGFLGRSAGSGYRGLAPVTKLVIALAEALIAFGVRGWSGPLLILVLVLVTGFAARVVRSFLPFLLATIPLLVSIVLVNTFLYPGATDTIVLLGPFHPTWTGLVAASQATARVVAFAMSVALLGLTTTTDDLMADLEQHGLGRRLTFVIGATVRMVPRMLVRAGEITEAQRARGLDTQGSIRRRIQGLIPLAGPLVIGALTDVEEQTMALEARAFTAPGRRTVLRTYPGGAGQRLVRWGLTLGTAAALILSVTGQLAFLP